MRGLTVKCGLILVVAGVVACGDSPDDGGEEPALSSPDSGPGTNTDRDQDASGASDALTNVDGSAVDAPIVQGGFGSPCNTNSECESEFCVQSDAGSVCTKLCLEDCPTGWGCVGVTNSGADATFICMPVQDSLCEPCTADLQCGSGRCLTLDEGNFCARPCADDKPCPDGFSCDEYEDAEGKTTTQCVPVSGQCSCTQAQQDVERPCAVENVAGKCWGVQICGGDAGWGGCSATEPTAELCDGLDNDCDGIADEDVEAPSKACAQVNDHGTCVGAYHCAGLEGWTCTAKTPAAEVCDFQDNDCDGEADEDFVVPESGKYGTVDHCGSCNNSCLGLFPSAIPTCDVSADIPVCAVAECLPGFIQIGALTCLPLQSGLCLPCTSDEGCIGPTDKCMDLGTGSFCGRDCGPDAPLGQDCPAGYNCTDVGDDAKQCVPTTNTCDCVAQSAGVKKACSVTNEIGSCLGLQICGDGGWSACDASAPSVEICDGVDNDCDGIADEGTQPPGPCEFSNEWGTCSGVYTCQAADGWVCPVTEPAPDECNGLDDNCDGQTDEDFKVDGKYAVDEHCGSCGNSCLGAIANGQGACDPSYPTPKCVVASCEPGFFAASPFICMAAPDTSCQPCDTDEDCSGGFCLVIDGVNRCAMPCLEDAECDGESACSAAPGVGDVCLPSSGSCECSQFTAGAKRSCSQTNEVGICYGFQTCVPETGWTPCDALLAGPETCNGVDEDCNGLIDDGLPATQPCAVDNEFGQCAGTAVCAGSAGWLCQAATPAADACDYQDNDCDGAIDEDFIDGDGKYVHFDHCGSCDLSCANGFPNAEAMCDASKPTPKCVVKSCADGFFQLNEYQCIPNLAGLCEPCSADANCVAAGAKCVTLDDGNYCAKHCAGDGDCPNGYTCQPWDGGSQCFPATGSCGCDGSNTSLSKQCSATWPVSPAEGESFVTCSGSQQCTETGWSQCQLPAETCDGVDNDCNGTLDDGFLVDGKYASLENCGQCGNNCGFVTFANAKSYQPDFWDQLNALEGVEIVPHAHQTVVLYDELYASLLDAGAAPEKILGGTTFEQYVGMQKWFDANPGFVYWDAPLASPGHVDDKPTPPMVYRIAEPKDADTHEDLYVHVAASPIIVSPGLVSKPQAMLKTKPAGRYITPSYVFFPTRQFLAEPDDAQVPPLWRKKPGGPGKSAAELIAIEAQKIESQYQPLVDSGKVEFATVRTIIDLYVQYEACLDLEDQQDMSVFAGGSGGRAK